MDEELKRFLGDVKSAFSGSRILLFGSRAKGSARPDSDYDLIIVSRRFKGIPFADRPYHVWMKSDAVLAADLLCYSPEEMKSVAKKSVVLKDALKHAISV